MAEWDEIRIQTLINDAEEEKAELEYKAADALKDKERIRKVVSAMANSAGGVIIYGMKEKKDTSGLNNIPDGVEDVTPTGVTKETLEQIIGEIKPRIHNIIIYPVKVGGVLVYVVEVPEGLTAHMADDKKYYRRFNFEVKPMEDYEVRMTINRSLHPALEIKFYYEDFVKTIFPNPGEAGQINGGGRLTAVIKHIGGPLAEKIVLQILTKRYWTDKTDRNMKEMNSHNFKTFNVTSKIWQPLFPDQTIEFDIPLCDDFWGLTSHTGETVEYKLWADSAIPIEGRLDASNVSNDIKQINGISKRN